VAAVTLAACGSSSSASTTTSSAAHSSGSSSGSGSSARQFPGTSGSIAAINGTSMEVQNPNTGQTTVSYTPTTTFEQTITTTASSVTVGSWISAFGKPTNGSSSSSTPVFGEPVTATTVTISQPTSGSCTGGFGGAGGGAGGFRRSGSGGGFPGGGSGERPAGGGGFRAGGFASASGPVTAVNGTTATVTATDPQTKKTSSVVVTLTSSTVFTERTTAAASDLAVGKCATAIGTADSTGAVTARSITISTAGANGCTTGFGGFRGGFGGGGAPGGNSGA
jgi:hypothetical protein